MKPFKMALPRTVDEAVSVGSPSFRETKMLAAGTDLLAELKERTQTPELLVNLKRIPGMNTIRRTERGLEIGALTTLSAIAENSEIRRHWPALVTTIQRTATPQIRNMGTLGGNLCQRPRCWYYRHELYPCLKKGGRKCYAQAGENEYHSIFGNGVCCAPHPSNTAPVLIAYGAEFEIHGPGGTQPVAAEDFFVPAEKNVTVENILRPNDILTRVLLPAGSESRTSAYCEAREKQSFDWALCGASVNLRVEAGRVREARIVLSAVAPTPLRRPDLEKMVVGKTIDERLLEALARAATQGATPLADNGYKTKLVKTVLKRAVREAMKG